ncbi:TPA: DUF3501 family protein [Candidatus Poribacteria bacterium]|nr:DUF3501 family protein [Candidatus Poribacteria bacterium]HIA67632.1 DUF3501 family protein [Candidatus Poribacteria bacterium]HIB91804.1 DUF3501 family protein [Candidatus Poribacteria bacterium]HIC01469.1 DUF3501 family protein [Candidatus Poribacteria bacterium]HIC19869.1 DUF3501 family protein [Candidatus Poribacteria bacterium]
MFCSSGVYENTKQLGEDEKIPAIFEPSRSCDGWIAAGQYVSFKFSSKQVEALKSKNTKVCVIIDYPNYQEKTEISSVIREEFIKDLCF